MPTNKKGDRRERELVNRLDEAGFAVMRAPASGSATQRELPDVLAGNGDAFYAIEAKSSAGDPIYLTGEEVQALVYFSQNFGAKPRVAVRFDREDWYFFHPSDCYTTDGGNYRVKKETALAEGTDMAELVGDTEKITLAEATERGHVNGGGSANDGDADDEHADDDAGDADEGIRKLLQAVADGTLTVEEAADALA